MNNGTALRSLLLGACLTGVFPAWAAEDSTNLAEALALEPPTWDIGNTEVRLGGFAGGTVFTATQSGGPGFPGGYDDTGGSGLLTANLRIQRTYDNGLIVGARSDFLLHHDKLSGDNYGNDTVERLYVFAQTGFGRVELGQQDGAAYTLGLVGPIVDEAVTLENRNISHFRDPVTKDDFAGFFQQTTAVQSTSNYAKLNYITPRLFGVQLGASFTPSVVRTPLPFTGNSPDTANHQENIFEFAVNYTSYVSDLAVGLSAGYAHGSVARATASGADLQDFAFGAQFAYMISDVRLSWGGAYRVSNTYLLDINQARKGQNTHGLHLSAMAEYDSWLLGVEYSDADINGPVDHDITGYQVSLGYKLNDNLQITAGWQWYDYNRNIGVFYNGKRDVGLSAGFLSFGYAL
jgi:outer membrane protein OmpU